VGWICALPTELAAAEGMLDEHHNSLQQQDSNDHNTYVLGRIGVHNVVLACLPSGVTGTTSTAIVATQMLSSFKWLRFGFMVGIGGGAPSEENGIRLGDVVVSQPTETFGGVIQHDSGKRVQGGRFKRTHSLNKPPTILLTALAKLQAKHLMKPHELLRHLSELVMRYPNMQSRFTYQGAQHDLLYQAEYDHPEKNATCTHCDASRLVDREARTSNIPVIHYGTIASGSIVMRDGKTRDQLKKDLDAEILCFEMEAAGLMDNFPCIVIRGICDYADSHKNKRWQPYAAATAAAYAKELLGVIPGNEVNDARTVPEIITEAG
jgi:nucleoside phosphorylase